MKRLLGIVLAAGLFHISVRVKEAEVSVRYDRLPTKKAIKGLKKQRPLLFFLITKFKQLARY